MSSALTTLTPLPWQADIWKNLTERHQQGRLPHALLLHGVAGVGKGHLARLLALRLLCEKVQQNLPCGQCHACQMFTAKSHPDFFMADPSYGIEEETEDSDSKTKKSKKNIVPGKQIKIDCIRDLIHFGGHTSHQGGLRIAIIEPAEWMNHNAANAVLKTLEEPGEGMLIILVSHQPSRLLPTLRSRCQGIFFPTPSHQQSMQWLKSFTSPERAEAALAFTHQAPLKALTAIQEGHDVLHQDVMGMLQACAQGKSHYLSVAEALAKHDAVMVLEWWITQVHQQVCQKVEAARVRFYDQLLDARRKALSTANPNFRFMLESLLIDWAALDNVTNR